MTATLTPVVPVAAPVEPGLDARLAARDAAMTVRLEQAAMRHAVDAAAPETVVDLPDVATAPASEETPVAALLHRARTRILAGWSRDAARTSGGGMCLVEAIRAEARSHADEGEARILLRRALGGHDPIPEQNRRLPDAAAAAAVLTTATHMATQQSL